MKKILYIFAFAASIVACDKNSDMEMSEPMAQTELSAESNESVDASAAVLNGADALIERLISGAKGRKNKASSSSKEVAASAGTYIRITSVTDATGFYEFVFDDEQEVCLPSGYTFADAYAILNDDNGIDVALTSDGTPIVTIDGNYEYLFNIDFFKGSRINFDGTSAAGTVASTAVSF